MGYKIHYNKMMEITTKYEKERGNLRLKYITITIWLAVIVLTIWQNRTFVIEALVPGDNAVTVPAFNRLVENVSEGTNLTDSVAVFCRDILDHGQSANT